MSDPTVSVRLGVGSAGRQIGPRRGINAAQLGDDRASLQAGIGAAVEVATNAAEAALSGKAGRVTVEIRIGVGLSPDGGAAVLTSPDEADTIPVTVRFEKV